jgi:hypothetical protein
VVDVGDDAEVPDPGGIREGGVGEAGNFDSLLGRLAGGPAHVVLQFLMSGGGAAPTVPQPGAYPGGMADEWARLGRTARRLAAEHGPKLAQQVLDSAPVRAGRDRLARAVTEALGLEAAAAPVKEFTPGRPVVRTAHHTELMARAVVYAPQLDGRADPGEVVWAWVEFEESSGPEAGRGKDRPVLVVGRSGESLLGLMLSSRDRSADPGWHTVGVGTWDAERRASWVRLDRVLDVPEDGIRREGAVLDRARFESVARRLRAEYGWS